MKKLFYLAIGAVVLVACSQSQEQKAEALIKESLKKELYKPETYKPVDTQVDSAFAPYDDPAFFEEMKEIAMMGPQVEELEHKVKSAKSSMALWSDSYRDFHRDSYMRNRYEEEKAEYEEANTQLEKLRAKVRKQFEKLKQMLQDEPKFIGYKATHNYRADNNLGNTLIGNSVFFIDKNFEEVVYSMKLEDYKMLQAAIKMFEDNMDEFDFPEVKEEESVEELDVNEE